MGRTAVGRRNIDSLCHTWVVSFSGAARVVCPAYPVESWSCMQQSARCPTPTTAAMARLAAPASHGGGCGHQGRTLARHFVRLKQYGVVVAPEPAITGAKPGI